MRAIFKHEFLSLFHSLSAWLFCAAVLLCVGIGSMIYNINATVANFEFVLSFVSLALAILIPVLTMRVIAEEKKQKTDQLLYSLPLSTTRIVLGKYFALLALYLIPILVISVYPLILAQYGDVYLATSYGSLFAFYLMSAAMISIGMFISSLTENQGFAAGMTIVFLLLNYYCVSLSEFVSASSMGTFIVVCILILILGFVMEAMTQNDNVSYGISIVLLLAAGALYFFDPDAYEGILPLIMEQISLFERFYTIVNGVFDLTSIVFYLTVIVFFLFLTVQSLEKRRYN